VSPERATFPKGIICPPAGIDPGIAAPPVGGYGFSGGNTFAVPRDCRFDALHRRGTVREAMLYAFDLLELLGETFGSCRCATGRGGQPFLFDLLELHGETFGSCRCATGRGGQPYSTRSCSELVLAGGTGAGVVELVRPLLYW
jgi:hypothetical protein